MGPRRQGLPGAGRPQLPLQGDVGSAAKEGSREGDHEQGNPNQLQEEPPGPSLAPASLCPPHELQLAHSQVLRVRCSAPTCSRNLHLPQSTSRAGRRLAQQGPEPCAQDGLREPRGGPEKRTSPGSPHLEGAGSGGHQGVCCWVLALEGRGQVRQTAEGVRGQLCCLSRLQGAQAHPTQSWGQEPGSGRAVPLPVGS